MGPVSVFAADVDGDGDIDVLSASVYDDKIAWYENDGSQNFTAHTISTAADGARSVYAADVDGDGDIDVLSASHYDDKIAWYENDGSQNFTRAHHHHRRRWGHQRVCGGRGRRRRHRRPLRVLRRRQDRLVRERRQPELHARTITTAADGARSVFAADVDGDGDLDVLSASLNDDKIAWYENDRARDFGDCPGPTLPRPLPTVRGTKRPAPRSVRIATRMPMAHTRPMPTSMI